MACALPLLRREGRKAEYCTRSLCCPLYGWGIRESDVELPAAGGRVCVGQASAHSWVMQMKVLIEHEEQFLT